MARIAKAIRNPRLAYNYFKYRLQYIKISLMTDDTESLSFYRHLQNQKVRAGEAYQRGLGIGKAQIEFLERQGLSPSDSLLDIGCGDLRGGRYMIEYLDKGSYTGIDISEEAIKEGWKNLQNWGLAEKNATLLVNNDLRFSEFDKYEFDWVFANSVLTHLSQDLIAELLRNLGRILSEDGKACLSYHHSDEQEVNMTKFISTSNLYKYPFEDLEELANEFGFEATMDAYQEHPADTMNMIVLTKK